MTPRQMSFLRLGSVHFTCYHLPEILLVFVVNRNIIYSELGLARVLPKWIFCHAAGRQLRQLFLIVTKQIRDNTL